MVRDSQTIFDEFTNLQAVKYHSEAHHGTGMTHMCYQWIIANKIGWTECKILALRPKSNEKYQKGEIFDVELWNGEKMIRPHSFISPILS